MFKIQSSFLISLDFDSDSRVVVGVARKAFFNLDAIFSGFVHSTKNEVFY